jgi:PAS domain S-box-containing protein
MELRTSEERWRSLVDNPIFGVTFLDENHRFITASRTFQNMVGYSDEELRQLTPLDIAFPASGKSMKTSSAKCGKASDNTTK